MNSHTSFKKCFGLGLLFSVLMGLSGCGSIGSDGAPNGKFDASNIPDAVPKAEALSKYGNKPSYVVRGKRYYVLKNTKGYDKVGNASWYGTKFHGQRTSSYEPYNMYSMTAASTTLPIPCYVRVTNLENGRTAIVKVNDRGPFHSSRIIDLSYAAAQKLGYAGKGTAKVRVTAIDVGSPSSSGLFAQNNIDAPSPVVQTPQPTASKAATTALPPAIKTASPKTIQLAQATPKNSASVYVQVGAFRNRSSAENMSKRIIHLTKQVQVAVKEGTSSGSRVYRVHIGPLQDTNKSQQMVRLLAKNGFNKATVVTG